MSEILSLKGTPILTSEELAALEELGDVMIRPAGQMFFGEGEETDYALLIRKGHVKVIAGQPSRTIAIRSPGEFVGEMSAIRKAPRSATVIAFDDVEALRLPSAKWLRFLYDHPRAMHAQLIASEERIEQATRKIIDSDLAVEQRLAKAFVVLLEADLGQETPEGILVRLSQLDLAALIGASKLDSVKKVVRSLKDAELILTGRGTTTLLDPRVIRDIANGDMTAAAWAERKRRAQDVEPSAR